MTVTTMPDPPGDSYRFQAGRKVRLGGEPVPQPGYWLDLIQAANRIHHGMFGHPLSMGDWWAGGEVETYEDARVIHHADNPDPFYRSVSVIPLTDLGARVLAQAYTEVLNADAAATSLPSTRPAEAATAISAGPVVPDGPMTRLAPADGTLPVRSHDGAWTYTWDDTAGHGMRAVAARVATGERTGFVDFDTARRWTYSQEES